MKEKEHDQPGPARFGDTVGRGARLGERNKSQAMETVLRIAGSKAAEQILDVAAFNSFIG